MKKIVFFSKNLKIGGMEKSLVLLLNELSKDYDITLVLEENTGVLKDSLNASIKVKEYSLSNSKNVLLRKIKNGVKRLFWYLKHHNKYCFSCNYATYSIIGSRLAQISSKNSYLYIHSDYTKVYSSKKDMINFFNQHFINKYQGLIFVANEAKNNFLKYMYHSNTYVINNLIDYKNIIQKSKEQVEFMFDNKKVSFLFVGRLDNTSKNFELLLNSFAKINKKANLYIIGEGYYKEEINKIIKKLQIQNSVFLLGEKLNPYPYMKNADCLILTSKYEGFPVVYLEALVLNKQMITTVPVSDDNIKISNYFICVDQNDKAVYNEMQKIKKDTIINYDLNYNSLNKSNLEKIIKLIEE